MIVDDGSNADHLILDGTSHLRVFGSGRGCEKRQATRSSGAMITFCTLPQGLSERKNATKGTRGFCGSAALAAGRVVYLEVVAIYFKLCLRPFLPSILLKPAVYT